MYQITDASNTERKIDFIKFKSDGKPWQRLPKEEVNDAQPSNFSLAENIEKDAKAGREYVYTLIRNEEASLSKDALE